jgi:hypothetical protein
MKCKINNCSFEGIMKLKTFLSTVSIFAAFLSVSSLVVSSPASAQLGEIIDGIGFGKEKDPIEYKERAPLVVPPSFNLRPPEEKSAASRIGNWPNDPDIAKKKAKDEDDRRPRSASSEKGGPKLSADELQAGRISGNSAPVNGQFDPTRPDSRGWLSPDVIRSQGQTFRGNQEPDLKPGEEPKRKYLTDPPKGIRAAAKGAPVTATRDTSAPSLDEESSPYSFILPKKQDE